MVYGGGSSEDSGIRLLQLVTGPQEERRVRRPPGGDAP